MGEAAGSDGYAFSFVETPNMSSVVTALVCLSPPPWESLHCLTLDTLAMPFFLISSFLVDPGQLSAVQSRIRII